MKRFLAGLSVLAAAAAVLPASAPADAAASAGRRTTWAPAASAVLHPGVQVITEGGGFCTTNFVYTDSEGGVYLGYAAHCAAAPNVGQVCGGTSLPMGTKVSFLKDATVAGGTTIGTGTLVYNAYEAMNRVDGIDPVSCPLNDLALIRVDPADVAKVNPSVPVFGGPTGVHTGALVTGEKVYGYGNSPLRAGVTATSPKVGVAYGDDPAAHGWTHPVLTVSPGVPGDSGSGYLDASGRAVGILSTLTYVPPGGNNVSDLAQSLDLAQRASGIPGLRLASGTEPFKGLLAAGLL